MIIQLKDWISFVAIPISLIALYFTFRKDAHRIRLEVTPQPHYAVALGVNNDSACDADVLSVGFFNEAGKVKWVEKVGSFQTNQWISYPITVKGRSLFVVTLVAGRDIPHADEKFGYCVQLATGRIYVLRNTAPWDVAFKMHFASLVSRLTGGRFTLPVIPRVRLPSRDFQ